MSHEAIWFLNELVEVLIDATDTGGAYDAATFTSAAGGARSPHSGVMAVVAPADG